jgi:hypothetical protein
VCWTLSHLNQIVHDCFNKALHLEMFIFLRSASVNIQLISLINPFDYWKLYIIYIFYNWHS